MLVNVGRTTRRLRRRARWSQRELGERAGCSALGIYWSEHGALRRQARAARQILKKLSARKLRFTPRGSDRDKWFEWILSRLLAGSGPSIMVASPAGVGARCTLDIIEFSCEIRRDAA